MRGAGRWGPLPGARGHAGFAQGVQTAHLARLASGVQRAKARPNHRRDGRRGVHSLTTHARDVRGPITDLSLCAERRLGSEQKHSGAGGPLSARQRQRTAEPGFLARGRRRFPRRHGAHGTAANAAGPANVIAGEAPARAGHPWSPHSSSTVKGAMRATPAEGSLRLLARCTVPQGSVTTRAS